MMRHPVLQCTATLALRHHFSRRPVLFVNLLRGEGPSQLGGRSNRALLAARHKESKGPSQLSSPEAPGVGPTQMAESQSGSGQRWRIESVEENFKVVFMHNGTAYELGLFSTREEGTRVADVLTIKEAVDAGDDLSSLKLEYPLDRYGVDNTTAHEIRSVSFNQVVRDLQCCCVEQLVPDGTVPGWTSELPTTAGQRHTMYRSIDDKEYHDAISQDGWAGALSNATEEVPHAEHLAPKGLPQLPPKPAGRTTSAKGQGVGPSAATTFFQAAGKANADVAAAANQPAAAGDMRAPPPRPPLSQRTGPSQAVPSHGASVGGPSRHHSLLHDEEPSHAGGAAAAPPPPPHADQEQPGARGASREHTADTLVLRVPPNMQPIRAQYRGITQAGKRWRCQTHIGGRNVGVVAGSTQMEAALVYDLLSIWKHFKQGENPATGDYNFSFQDIAKDGALLTLLRDCATSDMATNILSGLVSQGAIARVFGLEYEPAGPKLPKHSPPKPASGKKMHWRTRERLEREKREREEAGGNHHANGEVATAAAAAPAPVPVAPTPRGKGQEERVMSEGEDEEGRPRKKPHWRTVARLEREQKEAAAVAAAAVTSASPAFPMSPGKKLHWKTAAKLEREHKERAAQLRAAQQGEGGRGMPSSMNGGLRETEPSRYVGVSANSRGSGWRCLVSVRLDEQGRVASSGTIQRNFTLPVVNTQEEAAAAHDLACMWLEMQVGRQPHDRQYHLPYHSYQANPQLMAGLRKCTDMSDVYTWLKQVKDDGTLAALARALKGAIPQSAGPRSPPTAALQLPQRTAAVAVHPALAHPWDSHPFHGITATTQRDQESGNPLMHAQFTVKVDGAGRVSQAGVERRSVHLVPCRTAAEAAVAFDIAHIWRQLQVGHDPATAEEDPTPRYRYNFGYSRYSGDAQLMKQIRAAVDIPALQAFVKELNKQGKLRQLAIAAPPPSHAAQRTQQQPGAAAPAAANAAAGLPAAVDASPRAWPGPERSLQGGEDGQARQGTKRPAPPAANTAAPLPPQKSPRAGPAPIQRQEQQQDGSVVVPQPAAAVPAAAVAPPGPYEPREEGRIQAVERMCNDVKRMLADVGGGITQMQAVAFLSYYVRMRDLWRYQHQEIKRMYDARQYGLIVQYVHEALGIRAGQGH